MTVLRLEHVGIVVGDLEAAVDFFVDLGLERQGSGSVEGEWVDRIVGLEGTRSDFAIMQTPDGNGRLELVRYRSPAFDGEAGPRPANAPGLNHVLFAVDDIEDTLARLRARGAELVGELTRYGESWWLCYVRGPEGIIVELAQKIE